MKYILTTCICLLSLSSLHSQILTNNLFQNWIKVASYDPYDKIISQKRDTSNFISRIDTAKYKSSFLFKSNGEVFSNDNWNNKGIGKWKWNSDSTKIGINYLKLNEQVYEDKPISEYQMYIYKLKKDSLIMGWQGRHGIVQEYYVPMLDQELKH